MHLLCRVLIIKPVDSDNWNLRAQTTFMLYKLHPVLLDQNNEPNKAVLSTYIRVPIISEVYIIRFIAFISAAHWQSIGCHVWGCYYVSYNYYKTRHIVDNEVVGPTPIAAVPSDWPSTCQGTGDVYGAIVQMQIT